MSTHRPCQHPAEPCSRNCRYRLYGKATCALVAAQAPRSPSEIAKLAGMPLRLVTMALESGQKRWRKGMVAAGVRAPNVRSAAHERTEVMAQLTQMLGAVVDVPAHGPGRRLTVEEIRKAYPGVKISRKG